MKGKEKWSSRAMRGEFREFLCLLPHSVPTPLPLPPPPPLLSPPPFPVFASQHMGGCRSEVGEKEGRRRSSLSPVPEECSREREHGYKRIALPLCCCDVTTQIFPPSFPSKSDLLTLLFLLNFGGSLLLPFLAK